MSKRNHVHRRKAYGRRQRELRERGSRQPVAGPAGSGWDEGRAEMALLEPFAYRDQGRDRLPLALGE